MKIKRGTIDVISMGCSKNLVDSERLMRRLEAKGYTLRHNPSDVGAEWVVVNTCGFIGDAKEESIEMILSLTELKEAGKVGNIAVMGCLSQRYLDELQTEVPQVDVWYGKFDWKGFIEALPDRGKTEEQPKEWERSLTTPPWSAYLKISEGCDRHCAFCAIPIITGRHTSRPIEEIIEEAKLLVNEGVKELNVIAQDLSSYGHDLYGKSRLAELVDRLADIPGVEWIRLHYAYPAGFPMDVLDVMARRDNVAKYMDIALQHIADPVLKRMNRHIDAKQTRELLAEMRRRVPGLKLRTTMMVGFPGETEEDFRQLLEFVKEQKFERLGAFAYCEEEDTPAQKLLTDDIDDETKQRRLDQLMDLQQEVSLERNQEMVGSKIKVLVEEISETGERIGRSQWDSPEVDQCVYISDCDAKPGEMVYVEVTGAETYELYGRSVK